MKFVFETIRFLTIAVVSPCIGFGTLSFLDWSRIATPSNIDKSTFIIFGFAVAIGTGFGLFRIWPSYLRESRFKNPPIVLRVCLLVVGLIGITGFAIYIDAVLENWKSNTDDMRNAIITTKRYYQQNGGKWPQSWDQLRQFAPPAANLDRIQRTVEIDFGANLNHLAKQNWRTFTGIKPRHMCLGSYANDLTDLIELLPDH